MTNFELNKKNQTVTIFPISDVHIGTPKCDTEYFDFMLDKFDKTTGNKIIYLLGDLMDCATKRLGQSAYEQVLSAEEQLDYISKKLAPYKKHIRACVIGNHEARYRKEFDLDIMKILADQLDAPYVNEIYDTFTINDKPYTVWGNHGTKTSQQQHLMMGAVQRQTQYIEANLYLYGHCHYSSNWSQIQINKDEFFRKHYCLTGHYLQYEGSYAQEKLLKPNLPSFSKINIDSNLRTIITNYHKDECEMMQ